MRNPFHINRFTILVSFFFAATCISQPGISFLSANDSIIGSEIRDAVKKYGFDITVDIVYNKKTGLQDLAIEPAEGHSYSSGSFVYAVSQCVAKITSKSFTYRLYFNMVIIDINDELWAISAENCRKTFELGTIEEQNEMLRKSLKRLR